MPAKRHLPIILLALGLAACSNPPPPDAAPALDAAASREALLAQDGPIDARYLCDGGNRVDLIHARAFARVAMSDGRIVRLGTIANSQPATWTDVGLRFVIDGDYVELSQTNGARTLMCQPEDDAPAQGPDADPPADA